MVQVETLSIPTDNMSKKIDKGESQRKKRSKMRSTEKYY